MGPRGRGRALDPRGHPVRQLTLLFFRKKANFMRKNWVKDSTQSVLRISGYKRNGERAAGGAQKQRETERQIQSRRGSRPSHAMKAKDQRGNPSPIYGGGQGRRRRRGPISPSLPVAPERCRGHQHHHRDLHQHLHHVHNISITFPPLSTAVHSPTTRCTLYLNMVLYASYYYPMMCCHPMMSE